VLDQHLAHIGFCQTGIDRLLGVLEKLLGGFSEFRFAFVGVLDHRAQRLQHHRQVGLELLDGFAKFGDLGTFVVEEEV
jgi:hypothetical protein